MIEVGALVGDIPAVSVTVRRFSGHNTDLYGETTSSSVDTEMDAVVHPAAADVLESVPEADRRRETVSIYANDAVLLNDHVLYNSVWYEVIESANYNFLGDIYICVAQRIESQ